MTWLQMSQWPTKVGRTNSHIWLQCWAHIQHFCGCGLSLTFSAWTTFPDSNAILVDKSVFKTIGSFVVGLIWALVVLQKRKLRTDKCFGSGLLVIYLQMTRSLGPLEIHMSPSKFNSVTLYQL